MASIEEILGRKIESVKELRKYITDLQNSLLGLDKESDEYKQTVQQLVTAQGELNNITKAGKTEFDAAKDSIAGMEKEYRALYNTYKMLSEEQRNSPIGREMAKSLDELSTKLNESKKEVGNFKDNIGHYAEGAIEAFQKMGISVGSLQKPLSAANGGMKAFNTTLKANPILAVVAAVLALVNILKKGVEAIGKNEESQNRLNRAMATFQPIIDAVSNAFDRLGQHIVSAVEFVAKAVDKIREVKAAFTDFLGITKGAKEELKQQQAVYKGLAESQEKLTKARREANVEASKKSAEVERLREEASETDNLVEKKKKLEEAKRIQGEIDQQNIELAQEELRILQTQDELTANSAEDNEKLAAALQKVADAEARAASNARNFNKQLNSVKSSSSSAGRSVEDFKKKAQDLYKSLQEDNKTEIVKIKEKYEEEKKLLEKYHLDTTLLTKKYNKDIEEANERSRKTYLDNLRKFQVEQNNAYNNSYNALLGMYQEMDKYDPIGANEGRIKQYNKKLDALNSIYDNIRNILNSFNESDYGGKEGMEEFLTIMFDTPIEQLDGKFLSLSEALTNVNEKFGLNIKSIGDLRNEIMHTQGDIKKLDLDNLLLKYNEKIDRALGEYGNILQEEFGMEPLIYGASDAYTKVFNKLVNTIKSGEFKEAKEQLDNFFNFNDKLDESTIRMRVLFLARLIEELREKMAEDPSEEIQAQLGSALNEYVQYRTEWISKLDNLNQLAIERTQELWDESFNAFDRSTSSISSMIGTFQSLIQAEVQEGKISRAEAEKKIKTLKNLEKVQLAVSVANIAASTAGGIMDVWRGYAGELVVNAQTAAAAGPAGAATKAVLDAKSLASAILRTTGLAATALAQLAAARGSYISNTSGFNELSAGSTSGAIASPETIDSSIYSYYQERQSLEMEQLMNRPVYVLVSDIEEGLNTSKVRVEESTF